MRCGIFIIHSSIRYFNSDELSLRVIRDISFLFLQDAPEFAEGRVLVRFKASVMSLEEKPLGIRMSKLSQMQPFSTQINSTDTNLDWETVDYLSRKVPIAYDIVDGMSVEDKVEELRKRGDIDIAEPDYKVEIYKSPSDDMIKYQWHHDIIDSFEAWDKTTGSSEVKVCVIDSGSKTNHPDLAGNVIKGWNVVPRSGETYPTPGSEEWANYDDTLGHGTHVAGLVGAVADNARGVAGVAWKVGILSCRFITDSGAGYVSDAITCIRLCRKEGAQIYSNSWGGVSYSDMLHNEIKELNAEEGLFIVAAGNNNGLNLDRTPLYPAAYKEPNVLTIASTTNRDLISSFSNVGKSTVGMAAPGSSIYSTTFDGAYGTMSGTSMATPIVAGAAALLKSVALNHQYPLTAEVLKSLLVENGDSFPSGELHTSSGKRLNVKKSLGALLQRVPKDTTLPEDPLPKSPSSIPQQPRQPETSPDSSSDLCGTSVIKGRPASQSSTYKSHGPKNAVDGDCRHHARKYPSACAITDPRRSYPWWTSSMPSKGVLTGVTITTRADCCSSTISRAHVYVGNTTWNGSGDKKRFSLCGRVPKEIKRGSPITVSCSTPVFGKYIAVYLPKKRASLSLCEVDAMVDGDRVPNRSDCRKATR